MIVVDYASPSILIKEFLKKDNVSKLQAKTFLQKLGFKKRDEIDVYFHTTSLNKEIRKKIQEAKLVIVSSQKSKENVINAIGNLNEDKVEIIYPCINEKQLDEDESKKILSEEFSFDVNKKIILFTARNLKKNGVKDFIDITNKLNYKNKQIIIEGQKEQIDLLKISFKKEKSNILFISDYKNKSLLFSAADIFLLPTKVSSFISNVNIAMFHKCAVFVCSCTSSVEVLDVYSTMKDASDGANIFKIDALLGRINDLNMIKEENHNKAANYLLEYQMNKLDLQILKYL